MNQPTNIKDGKVVDVMHGECYFHRVNKLPEAETKETKESIVGHSETGHHHVLVSEKPFELIDETEKHDLYVKVFGTAEVEHKKTYDIHETQTLVEGDYAIYHKTEYDPFAQIVRAVYD